MDPAFFHLLQSELDWNGTGLKASSPTLTVVHFKGSVTFPRKDSMSGAGSAASNEYGWGAIRKVVADKIKSWPYFH